MSNEFKNEPYFMIWRGWIPLLFLHKAEYCDFVLSGIKYIEKPSDYDFIKPWLNDGLLVRYYHKPEFFFYLI